MDGTITIYSKRDERGNNYYGDCTLLTGLGNVVFVGGRADVTPDQAVMLAKNPQVVLTHEGGQLEAGAQLPSSGVALPLGLQDASPEELEWCATALEAYRSGPQALDLWTIGELDRLDELARVPADAVVPGTGAGPTPETVTPASDPADDGGELEPAPGATATEDAEDADDPDTPRPEDQKVDPSIAAAQEMLREEGEHVPKALPDGFEPTTSENEPRCYARKGDGTQCTNPAKPDGEHSSYACGLGKHVDQVAKLP